MGKPRANIKLDISASCGPVKGTIKINHCTQGQGRLNRSGETYSLSPVYLLSVLGTGLALSQFRISTLDPTRRTLVVSSCGKIIPPDLLILGS